MFRGDEFDLEAVGVGEVGDVVIGSASVGMFVREQQHPVVCGSFGGQDIDVMAGTSVEREVVHPGSQPVVGGGGQGG